jgi:hypothetical protein
MSTNVEPLNIFDSDRYTLISLSVNFLRDMMRSAKMEDCSSKCGRQGYKYRRLCQLNFPLNIIYFQMWCTRTTEIADILLSRDVHCPSKYRVIGTLSNMKEFSEAWNCPAGSPMNRNEKCVLW